MKEEILLDVKNLRTHFFLEQGVSKALNGISFQIRKKETLGVVGESGCGKSLTALSILQLVPNPPGKIVGGEILLEGDDLLKKSERDMQKVRGNKIAMIFQEPMTSLNPVTTVGKQIEETLKIHQKLTKKELREKAIEMLRLVKIPLPEQRYKEYPYQMSGGMRQRIMIAMALCCHPQLLICDEPTTALDVTVQSQILQLIDQLKKELEMSVLLITHDLGVVSQVADKVIVMYAGEIVEYGDTRHIFEHPLHPYTVGLLRSLPNISGKKEEQLYMIKGMVPNNLFDRKGCAFAPRCEYAEQKCFEKEPVYTDTENGRVKCHRYKKLEGGNANG